MATPPVFSVGQYNTAAYMNSIGLWLVKTQTVGTAVTSVTVTGAFSADYNYYLITYQGGTLSALADLGFYFGATPPANGYSESQLFSRYDTGASGVSTVNNGAQWQFIGGGDTQGTFLQMHVYNPFNSGLRKYMTFQGLTGVFSVHGTGIFDNTSSYTSFTIDPFGATTMTGGTIRVYGYRN